MHNSKHIAGSICESTESGYRAKETESYCCLLSVWHPMSMRIKKQLSGITLPKLTLIDAFTSSPISKTKFF